MNPINSHFNNAGDASFFTPEVRQEPPYAEIKLAFQRISLWLHDALGRLSEDEYDSEETRDLVNFTQRLHHAHQVYDNWRAGILDEDVQAQYSFMLSALLDLTWPAAIHNERVMIETLYQAVLDQLATAEQVNLTA